KPPPVSAACELLYGTSGWIAGLLAAHNQTGEPWILPRAVASARHLAIQAERLLRHERRLGSRRAGYAHGLRGMAAALSAVHAREADEVLGRMAAQLYHAASRLDRLNPTDERRRDERAASWCMGAAGSL